MEDSSASDLEIFKAPTAVIDAARPKNNDFEVFPENWDVVEMFLRLSTQWVFAGMGSIVGLNYRSIEFLFKIYNVDDKKGMFEDIRIIEAGALNYIREQENKKKV